MTEIKAYKVRNKDTGLYSSGGSNPKWNKKGKTWGSLGSVKNHLNMFCHSWRIEGIKDLPKEWEIVEFLIREEDINVWPARIVSDSLKRKAKIKEKYGWRLSNGLDDLKNVDLDQYRYCFEIGKKYNNQDFEKMLKLIKILEIKRENYRYRTPIIVFNNIEDAFMVKLSIGSELQQFIDLVELKDLLNG